MRVWWKRFPDIVDIHMCCFILAFFGVFVNRRCLQKCDCYSYFKKMQSNKQEPKNPTQQKHRLMHILSLNILLSCKMICFPQIYSRKVFKIKMQYIVLEICLWMNLHSQACYFHFFQRKVKPKKVTPTKRTKPYTR